ncbi:nucleotide exchange factor GrpE [Pararhodobacter sp.]|uniref:nucleotide exchange factor GrpE n=1 Tax=Pararhodobacter sp. TaxID=2127056 RepID=UPI002FDE430E
MAQPQNTENPDLSEPQTEAEPLDLAAALEQANAAFEVERSEMRDRLMRALADLENTRKRGEKDRREAAIYGGSKLARDLIPVYDNLSRALSVINDDTRDQAQGLVEGVELTLRELLNVLAKHGVERVSPQAGDMFDPHLHEAMFEAPMPGTRAGQIIQVVSDGFRMHEQLLRPAQVGVSSTPG